VVAMTFGFARRLELLAGSSGVLDIGFTSAVGRGDVGCLLLVGLWARETHTSNRC